jgi:hypothetical protein
MPTGLVVASARGRVMLAGLVCAVFAVLMPTLLTFGADVPFAVTAAALALMFAAVHLLQRSRYVVLTVGADRQTHAPGDGAAPVMPGRVTDPVHHPRRPRAPGLV